MSIKAIYTLAGTLFGFLPGWFIGNLGTGLSCVVNCSSYSYLNKFLYVPIGMTLCLGAILGYRRGRRVMKRASLSAMAGQRTRAYLVLAAAILLTIFVVAPYLYWHIQDSRS
jgi:hypothetical protein